MATYLLWNRNSLAASSLARLDNHSSSGKREACLRHVARFWKELVVLISISRGIIFRHRDTRSDCAKLSRQFAHAGRASHVLLNSSYESSGPANDPRSLVLDRILPVQ